MRLCGAIFDMDGTLLDSMPLWDDVGSRFLAARGRTAPPGMREDLKPLSMAQTARYLKERLNLPDSEEAIIREMNGMVERGYRESVPVKRDILPFLNALHKKGVAMCVATATDRPLAQAALRRVGLLAYFRFLLTCTEVGFGKDSPIIFETACHRLGTAKQDTVVFEDALHAVRTAKDAGFRVIAIEDDSCVEDAAEIRRCADQVITNYAEVSL